MLMSLVYRCGGITHSDDVLTILNYLSFTGDFRACFVQSQRIDNNTNGIPPYSLHLTAAIRCVGERLETFVGRPPSQSSKASSSYGESKAITRAQSASDWPRLQYESAKYIPTQAGPPFGCVELSFVSDADLSK